MLKSSRFRQNLPLLVILLAYFSLAGLYSFSTPIFEKMDEVWHLAYTKHLADGHGFPAVDPRNPARQEATQPPLYYLIGSVVIAGLNTDDVAALTQRNPYYRPIWDGVVGDNRNGYLHKIDEITPQNGAARAVRRLRGLSVLLSSITVVCAYRLPLTLFPGRRWLAAGAAALAAFTPRFLFTSGAATNDVMVTAMCALTGLAAMRLACAPRAHTRQVVVVGLALGAALLSKVSALIMLPVVALALLYAAYKTTDGKKAFVGLSLRWLLIVLVCAGAISGWWFVRNAVLLDGDFTGGSVHVTKWGGRPQPPTLKDWQFELRGLEESYWAIFGLNNLPIDRWINHVLFAVDRLALVGWIVLAVRQLTRRRLERDARFALLLLAVWIGGSLLSVGYWIYLMYGVNLGRLLYPALPAIALALALGLGQFFPERWRPAAATLSGLALFALAAACPFVYIRPNYAPPPILSEAEVGPLTGRLEASFQGQIELLGYRIGQAETRPGDTIALTLYYRALAPIGLDYTVFVHFVGPQGDILMQKDTYPGMGRYPTTMWQPGEIIADTFYLTLPLDAPAPATGVFVAGFYNHETGARLLVVDETGRAVADSARFYSLPILALGQ